MDSRFCGNDGLIFCSRSTRVCCIHRLFGIGEARPAGQRDARPLHAQGAGIGRTVGGVMKHGKRMVEEVFYIHAETFEVSLRGR